MFGDQETAGATFNVYEHQAGAIVHRQIEQRAGRVYMRIRKRPLTTFLQENARNA